MAVPVSAATIQVHPGPHALRDAIHDAHAGDTLRVHSGRYLEHVTVAKRLTIQGAAGKPLPVIDGRCRANDTILVTSSGVTLRRLKVVGADEGHGSFPSAVFFTGVRRGRAQALRVRDTCDAEYGINLFGTGPVKVIGNTARGFDDSGVYVGGIADTGNGRLLVKGNDLFRNSRGAIVEDTDRAADVRLAGNRLHDNTIVGSEGPSDGVFLHNGDGIRLVRNHSDDNGAHGYHADPNSDDNVFIDNTASGNASGPFLDEGTGNCGDGNTFDIALC
jgi:nitrous oxidase accessory protein NosD